MSCKYIKLSKALLQVNGIYLWFTWPSKEKYKKRKCVNKQTFYSICPGSAVKIYFHSGFYWKYIGLRKNEYLANKMMASNMSLKVEIFSTWNQDSLPGIFKSLNRKLFLAVKIMNYSLVKSIVACDIMLYSDIF